MGYFDPTYFDSAYFDTGSPTTGGGRRYRNYPIPIIDLAMHDDDLALIILEALDG